MQVAADKKAAEEKATAGEAAAKKATEKGAQCMADEAEANQWAHVLKTLQQIKKAASVPKSKVQKSKTNVEAGPSTGRGTSGGGTKVPRT